MGSKSEHALAIACVLIMCIMPVERLTKAENNVTPAPTIVISELINTDANLGKTISHHESREEDVIKDSGTEIPKDIEIKDTINDPNDYEPQIKAEKQSQPRKLHKGKWKKTQPVCKYTMNEIFLFGQDVGEITAIDINENVTIQVAPSTEPIKIEATTATETTDINDTGAKTDDDGDEANMGLKVTDVHSFEEWKSLKLQEQESKLADTEPSPARSVRAKKTQVNYGSQDCGAKVLAHSKDAKHVSAILDENRDLYMLNPCSNPIWFVIELCEPIQVQQVQLGNMELFSSAPKEFVVSVSERYPSRDWHSVGTFEAANDKTLQSFNIKSNDVMFAKYIKFEMKSHFSNEHFCPLTLVRVLGISMVDEFDESEQRSSKTEADDDGNDGSGSSSEDSQQQDNGPINAMFNMVKNAIGYADDAKKKAAESVTNGKEDKESGDNDTDSIDPAVESEVTLVTNHTEIVSLPVEISPLVTLIKTGQGEDLTAYIGNLTSYSPHIPLYVPEFIKYLSPVTQKLNAKVCWFLEFVCKVSLTSCLVHYPFNYSVFVPFSFDPYLQNIQNHVQEDDNVNNDSEPVNQDKLSNSIGGDTHYHPSNNHHQDSAFNDVSEDDSPALVGEITVSDTKPLDDGGSEVLQDTKLVSNEPVTVQSCDVVEDDKINPLLNLGSAKAQESNNIVERDKSRNLSSASPDVTEDLSPHATTDTAHEEPKNSNKVESATKPLPDESIEKQATPTSPVVINPVSPKDSVFMRLSNRIRVLEQNMSLSSDYLENLSRRYKEQMDEMQRAFNKTTSKLVATSRTANENDARQTELLKKAEAELEILKMRIQNLSTSHDQLNSKLVERHLCLIILELIIFIAVFITCLGRRINHTQLNLERSDHMIQQLTQVIEEMQGQRPHLQSANGHCKSVPLENANVSVGTASNNHRHERKRKKKLRRKNSNGSTTMETPPILADKDVTKCAACIENIGPGGACSAVNRSCCDQERTWDSNPLDLKIHGVCVKGRK